jgi:leucyl-tRNA synthetase
MSREQDLLLNFILIDARRVLERIENWKKDYINLFTQTRSKAHFDKIFASRFNDIPVEQILKFDESKQKQLFKFYHHLEDLYWYLIHTDDMPATLEDQISRDLYLLNFELAQIDPEANPSLKDIPEDMEGDGANIG